MDDENPGGASVEASTEPAAPPAGASEAGESGPRESADHAATAKGMNAFLRGVIGETPAATSKPTEDAETGEPTADEAAVEAGRAPERGPDGRFLPRRAAPEIAKQREELREEVRRELESERQREQETASASALDESERADAERFLRLNALPDDHPELAENDNYLWLQDYKRALQMAPRGAKQERALAELTVRAEREQMARDRDAFRDSIRTEISAGAKEFGVDPESWKTPGTTWLSMTRDARRPLLDRIAELERELHAARTLGPNGLGASRAPTAPGRSAAGAAPRTMNDWLRRG